MSDGPHSMSCPTCGEVFTSPLPIRVIEHIRNEFGPAEHDFSYDWRPPVNGGSTPNPAEATTQNAKYRCPEHGIDYAGEDGHRLAWHPPDPRWTSTDDKPRPLA